MMSLFSSFDLYFFYLFLIFVFFLPILFFSQNFYVRLSFKTRYIIISALRRFFLSLKPKNFNKSINVIIFSLFLSICLVNFLSVFSFFFPVSSQFGCVLGLSLIFWLRFIIFSVSWNLSGFFAHSIPEGTPIFLTFFIFLIELIRNLIRPLTLTVRLVANILAGHLLMILLSILVFRIYPLFLRYLILNLVEIFVALIQAYIFCTIISLYFSEIH